MYVFGRNQKEWMKETRRGREKEIAEEKGNKNEDDLGRRENRDEVWGQWKCRVYEIIVFSR